MATAQKFLGEAVEILKRISSHLNVVFRDEHSPDTFEMLFRDAKTLSEISGSFGFPKMERLADMMSTAVEPFRRLLCEMTPPVVEALFAAVSLLEKIVEGIRTEGTEPDLSRELSEMMPRLIEAATTALSGNYETIKEHLEISDAPPSQTQRSASDEKEPQLTAGASEGAAEIRVAEIRAAGSSTELSGDVSQAIRIRVDTLEKLMNLVGELVLVRNQALQYCARHQDMEVIKLSKQLNLLTSKLQAEVMKTRMQPVGVLFFKFRRLVRDLATQLNKEVELVLEGVETELDRALLEAIKDPIVHVIRNSIDHGLESPGERRRFSKRQEGILSVRARQEGSQIIIEVEDDGRGLDRDRIMGKAIEKGLVSRALAASLGEREIFKFIFTPGFSTAESLTDVSGRGVGMDVVRTHIEKIGGQVELFSEKGKGTIIRFRVPLTLVILGALLVRAHGESFAIPEDKVVELFRASRDRSEGTFKIEFWQNQPIVRFRGRLLPLLDLNAFLGGTSPERHDEGVNNVVVLHSDGIMVGLMVDEIQEISDIVIRPVDILKKYSIYSGATILGDGSVALILDVTRLIQSAKIPPAGEVQAGMGGNAATRQDFSASQDFSVSDAQDFLIFRAGGPNLFAIPLCLVERMEEIDIARINSAGGERAVPYRDNVMPLICLSNILPPKKNIVGAVQADPTKEKSLVLVLFKRGRYFGLEVEAVLDVWTVRAVISDPIVRCPEIIGQLIHDGRILTVIDAGRILDDQCKDMVGAFEPNGSSVSKNNSIHVLLVENSPFFRNHVGGFLRRHGFLVTTAVDGADAVRILEKDRDKEFSVVLSDIEMPNLNGIELAKIIRRSEKWHLLPVIFLGHKRDMDPDTRDGCRLYLEKFQADKLLVGIQSVVGKKG